MVPPEVGHQDPSAYPSASGASAKHAYIYFYDSTTLRGVTGGGQNSTSRRTDLPLPFQSSWAFRGLEGLDEIRFWRIEKQFSTIASMYFAVDRDHYIHTIDVCACARVLLPLRPLRLFYEARDIFSWR